MPQTWGRAWGRHLPFKRWDTFWNFSKLTRWWNWMLLWNSNRWTQNIGLIGDGEVTGWIDQSGEHVWCTCLLSDVIVPMAQVSKRRHLRVQFAELIDRRTKPKKGRRLLGSRCTDLQSVLSLLRKTNYCNNVILSLMQCQFPAQLYPLYSQAQAGSLSARRAFERCIKEYLLEEVRWDFYLQFTF